MRVRLVSDSHFSAAHRLHREDWDEARNRRVFDKCNNPNGHGHTYGLEVTVEGEIDPETGYLMRGIDRIVAAGAFPTVCIFRPTIGSELEGVAPPSPAAMREVFAHMWEACRRARLPVGVLPIEVSLVVQPEECASLAAPSAGSWLYRRRLDGLRLAAKPYVAWKRRPAGETSRPSSAP